LHGNGRPLNLCTAIKAAVLVEVGRAETKKSPKRPHSFYFDSASGVLLPYLSLNLSVLELGLTLPLRRLTLCRCLDTWG